MGSENKRDFDNFDEFANDYREVHDKSIKLSGTNSSYFCEYKIKELTKYESKDEALDLLDFGCGDGQSCEFFRKHFQNANIKGIDVSDESIKEANDKNIENANFESFNGLEIPEEDNSFDVVFTSMVFHHISHDLHSKLLSEINRVLKPNGRFYIFEHNPYNPLTRKVVRECIFDENAILLKPGYSVEMINKSGFKSNKLNYTIFFPRHFLFKWLVPIENYIRKIPLGAQYYIRSVK